MLIELSLNKAKNPQETHACVVPVDLDAGRTLTVMCLVLIPASYHAWSVAGILKTQGNATVSFPLAIVDWF